MLYLHENVDLCSNLHWDMINVISHLWKSLNKNKLPTNQEKQTVPKENIKVPKVHR